jgi:hypothetical protein
LGEKDENVEYIYRPWITVKGVRIYAKDRGKKAFKIPIKKE